MKKLVILSAVAALAAFGWASGADAKHLLAPSGVECTMSNGGPGLLADDVDCDWDDLAGETAYAITVLCGLDPELPNAKSASMINVADNTDATFLIASFNGAPSITSAAGCICLVKALILPNHPNKHPVGMAVCTGALTD